MAYTHEGIGTKIFVWGQGSTVSFLAETFWGWLRVSLITLHSVTSTFPVRPNCTQNLHNSMLELRFFITLVGIETHTWGLYADTNMMKLDDLNVQYYVSALNSLYTVSIIECSIICIQRCSYKVISIRLRLLAYISRLCLVPKDCTHCTTSRLSFIQIWLCPW